MTEDTGLGLDKASATQALSSPARRLHLTVLTHFVETATAPSRADLDRIARESGTDPRAALTELAENDVVLFDTVGEVRAAYPFSPTPTGIRVSWDGGPTVYAMCAVDALGISAMIDRPVVIAATEPDTDRTITVEVDHDQAAWTPATAVVYAGCAGDRCCPSADYTCRWINFFTSTNAAQDWADRHPDVSGAVLERPHALAVGIAEFATLMQPDDDATPDGTARRD